MACVGAALGWLAAAVLVGASSAACHTSYTYNAVNLTPVVTSAQDHSAKESLRILVFGDSGAGDATQKNVAEGMKAACADTPCDFGLLLGDNVYPAGVASEDDEEITRVFHDIYDTLGLELWIAPGNHDWYNDKAQTLQPAIDHTTHTTNATGTWKMPFAYFRVPHTPPWLHLFALDTSVLYDLVKRPGSHEAELRAAAARQLDAAREALCRSTGWKVLFGHHFVYSRGSGHGKDSGILAPQLHPLIGECGVQVFLAGHDHHQEHLVVSFDDNGRTVEYHQVIQGAAHETRRVGRGDVGPARQRWSAANLGFSLVDVSEHRLVVRFYVCETDGTRCKPAHEAILP